jgi:hypothetical protein
MRKRSRSHKQLCSGNSAEEWRSLKSQVVGSTPTRSTERSMMRDEAKRMQFQWLLRVRVQEVPRRHPPLRAPQEVSQELLMTVFKCRRKK